MCQRHTLQGMLGSMAQTGSGRGERMTNLDLWGNEVEEMPKPSKKTPTMQEMFGITEGHTCKECSHAYTTSYSNTYRKCELWNKYFRGQSSASDIRFKDIACGKFESDSTDNGK